MESYQEVKNFIEEKLRAEEQLGRKVKDFDIEKVFDNEFVSVETEDSDVSILISVESLKLDNVVDNYVIEYCDYDLDVYFVKEKEYNTIVSLGDYDILQSVDDTSEILVKYHQNVRSIDEERYLTAKELDLLSARIEVYDSAESGTEAAEAQFSIEDLLRV